MCYHNLTSNTVASNGFSVSKYQSSIADYSCYNDRSNYTVLLLKLPQKRKQRPKAVRQRMKTSRATARIEGNKITTAGSGIQSAAPGANQIFLYNPYSFTQTKNTDMNSIRKLQYPSCCTERFLSLIRKKWKPISDPLLQQKAM
jgi:hypothetical protein